MKETREKIEKWILAKTKEAKAKGVVFGMSGGVDSSVVAVLANRSLGRKALGLVLPCASNPKDRKLARLLAKKFGIRTEEIDLTDVFHSLKSILPEADKKTLGNLKARLRMAVLYHFANKYNYLVLGTSNKSELGIGYVTKYGDAGVDLEPIGGLYKTQVAGLAQYLGIPEIILRSPPTAGLWEGQTDRKEIGISYEKLDRVLEAMEKGEAGKLDRRICGKVRKMMGKSGHKRRMPDVCRI